jgi:sugar/nucleoside kinase (ribokinase family)
MSSASYDIIVSGHLCLDLIPAMSGLAPSALTASGRLFEVGPMVISTGGPVSNTGLALHRLGVHVGLMAGVGDDLIGQMIRGYLTQRDPDLARLIQTRAGVASSYSVVLSPGGADRTFLHCTGQNAVFSRADVDVDALRTAKIFHLGYPPLLPALIQDGGAELAAIYHAAKATGVVTSMDMAMPDPDAASGRADWPTILRNTLPAVDVFLPSLEEILYMLRRDDLSAWGREAAARVDSAYLHALTGELLSLGVVIAGVKLGERGLYLRTAGWEAFGRLARLNLDPDQWADQAMWQPAFAVQVAGTTGAGDAAIAGFLTALLHGQPPQEALRWGCAVGACCCEAPDSTSGIRPLAETLDRLAAGWPSVTLGGR